MPKVIIWRDGVIEMEFDPGRRDWRIGRSETNDITLLDPRKSVSRFHAELREENGRWVFADLDSQNGSWKDGRRIDRLVLEHGHEVLFGDYKFVFHDPKPAPAPPAVAGVDTAPAEPSNISLMPGETLLLPRTDADAPDTYPPTAPPVAGRPARPTPARKGLHPALVVLFLLASLAAGAALVWRVLAARQPATPAATPVEDTRSQTTPAATTSIAPAADSQASAGPSSEPATHATPPPGGEPPAPKTESADARETPSPRPKRTQPATPKESPAVLARYQDGRRALAERRFVDAQRAFEAVLAQQPDFRDTRALLQQARRRADAQEKLVAEAHALEARGDWSAAIAAYERAGAASQAAAARAKMHAAGDDAYRKARQFDARDRTADAMTWYQRAVAWLPDRDPRRAIARDRLSVLEGGVR